MKIELNENKVFLENKGLKKEIHPFWDDPASLRLV